jgi:hypothetical protein
MCLSSTHVSHMWNIFNQFPHTDYKVSTCDVLFARMCSARYRDHLGKPETVGEGLVCAIFRTCSRAKRADFYRTVSRPSITRSGVTQRKWQVSSGPRDAGSEFEFIDNYWVEDDTFTSFPWSVVGTPVSYSWPSRLVLTVSLYICMRFEPRPVIGSYFRISPSSCTHIPG